MAAVPASAAPTYPDVSKLTPALAAIAEASPDTTGALKAQANSLGLSTSGPGGVAIGPDGTINVSLRVSGSVSDVVSGLQAIGAADIAASDEYKRIAARVPADKLNELAALPDLASAAQSQIPTLNGTPLQDVKAAVASVSSAKGIAAAETPVGAADVCTAWTSEADKTAQLNVSGISGFPSTVNGSGVKIGVISDSYDRVSTPTAAADDVASGALPGTGNACGYTTPVTVVADDEPEDWGPTDEGRAMLQLVHKVAPAAQLYFATAFGPTQDLGFANNIKALRDLGVDVIVDDVSYFNEPAYQDGMIANAVTDVVNSGVTYLSSAGNNNIIKNGKDIASGEYSSFRPGTDALCPASVLDVPGNSGALCNNMNPSGSEDTTAGYTLPAHASLQAVLQYNEPQDGITDNLNVYLVSNGGALLASDEYPNKTGLTQQAFGYLDYKNTTNSAQVVSIVVARTAGSGIPRFRTIMMGGVTDAEYQDSSGVLTVGPTIYGHNGGINTISIAANPFNAPNSPETYSSRGPVVQYYAPVSGSTPAAALSSPSVLARPDVSATDGDCTTFFGQDDVNPVTSTCPWRFFGTSAAAPNAAGVAALLLQKASSLTNDQIRAKLKTTASVMTGGSVNSRGTGRINALSAYAIAPGAPSLTALTAKEAGSGQAVAAFSAPTSNGGSAVIDYTTTCTSGQGVTSVVTATSPATVGGLAAGVSYSCSVTARTSIGAGVASNALSVTVAAAPVPPPPAPVAKPGKPTITSAKAAKKKKATITFSAPGATLVKTECIAKGAPKKLVTGANSGKTVISGLKPGKKYKCTVEGFNSAGSGGKSNQSKAFTAKA